MAADIAELFSRVKNIRSVGVWIEMGDTEGNSVLSQFQNSRISISATK